jgi:hypothetical protein
MCKPGSGCCGCGTTSGGLGLACAALAIAGAVSMAAALINDLLTVVLVTVLGAAAAGSIMVAVILWRSRGVVTWPMRPRLPAAGQRPAAVTAARPAIPARQPLAIEGAAAPACLRAGLAAGIPGLAAARQPARLPGRTSAGPASRPVPMG